jgi:hypothetical protein
MPENATLIDASELAEHLDVSIQAVYRVSASGRIPKYTLGHRTVRFCLDDVLAALKVEREPTTHETRSRPTSPPSGASRLVALPTHDWSKPS